jgi:hypothetical protein
MAPPERRRQLHGWVSVEALDGWQRFADLQGTNVTALLESFGQYLAELPPGKMPQVIAEIVRRSQQVAGTRSSRARRSSRESI